MFTIKHHYIQWFQQYHKAHRAYQICKEQMQGLVALLVAFLHLWTFTSNKNEATALSSTRGDRATGNATGELDLLDVTEENFGTYSCVAVNIILKSDKFYHTVSVICIHYPNCRVLYYTLNLLQLL